VVIVKAGKKRRAKVRKQAKEAALVARTSGAPDSADYCVGAARARAVSASAIEDSAS
jgi:hypothetical protein